MKTQQRKKILITGGTGFIGSNLILQLQDKYKIVCLGRGTEFGKFKNLTNKNVSFVKSDIRNEAIIDKHIKGSDAVIHLAGGGGNSFCVKDPVWALNTHIKGTHTLVKLSVKYKIKKFIFASSYLAYGASKYSRGVVKENSTLAPKSFYASLKSIAEQIIINSGLNYSIIRLANVYGYTPLHKLQSAGAVNNFIRACLTGKNIQVQGSGKQQIDYIHIQDTTRAIISILEKGLKKSIYNIGSGNQITIQKLAKTVQAVCKKLYKK